eukprot:5920111-Heterocapsa_arctica.AAC.1
MPRFLCNVSADPKLLASDIDTGDYVFHNDILAGTATVPTIIAPTPPGAIRAPPRVRTPRDPEAVQRWHADFRQFATWHYEERAILRHRQDATRWLLPTAD